MLRSAFPNGAPVFGSDTVRLLERLAAEREGLPGSMLMQRAGAAALRVLLARWPEAQNLLIVCGRGNNGGDGFVLARLAHEAGLSVTLAMPEAGASNGDAGQARAACPLPVQTFTPTLCQTADLIVDALCGIGLAGALRAELATAVQAINVSGRPVFALDCPSGLDADTGIVAGEAVRATLTLTFIARKPGLLTPNAEAWVGELACDELGLGPATLASVLAEGEVLFHTDWQPCLKPREPGAHKGRFGHVLVVGGSRGMGGAARLCAEAALRSGAGLVSAYCHESAAQAMLAARPEIMALGYAEAPEFESQELARLAALQEKAHVLAIGPGLGQQAWAGVLLDQLLATGKPAVLDADALNTLAANPQPIPQAVLTPHPGEAARMLGVSVAAIEADRLASARALRERFQAAAVLLKGRRTVVVEAAHFSLIAEGNPGMASGGMGDLLTGIIAALLAQGLSPFDAARLGASLHAWAGDRAAADIGQRGLVASDLLTYLPHGLNP